MMVFCSVHAFGKSMTAQLPVMDHRNKAIPNPDAMAVNTAMQRCLAKAIALHGIGLYIYAGEDLPLEVIQAVHQGKRDWPTQRWVQTVKKGNGRIYKLDEDGKVWGWEEYWDGKFYRGAH